MNEFAKAEEFARLQEDSDLLRLLGSVYATRGDSQSVRRISEALRARGEPPDRFVPLAVLRLFRLDRIDKARELLEAEWEQWPRDLARWRDLKQSELDQPNLKQNGGLEIECLYLVALHAAGETEQVSVLLKQLQEQVESIDSQEQFAKPYLSPIHFRSDACTKLAVTAANIERTELARELFAEALSYEDSDRIAIMYAMAEAGLLDLFPQELAKQDADKQPYILSQGMRTYYKSLAERNPEQVDFSKLADYEDVLVRDYAELGTLEGLLSRFP